MTGLARTESLDPEGALLQLETNEGPLELRCTYNEAQALLVGLQKAAKPPFAHQAKPVARWETSIDPVNQDAVIRAHYPDDSAQETRIPRNEVAAIAQFLEQARRRFEGSAEMRQ
jgi:hypothetical protein